MNTKISKTILILMSIFMIAFWILKLAFPKELLLIITNKEILSVGFFLDNNIWALHLYKFLSTMLTFYLFLCASKGKFNLSWIEFISLALLVVLNRFVSEFIPEYYIHISTASMFILSCIGNGKLLYSTITFTVHGLFSMMLFNIRGFETILLNYNMASGIVLSIEGYCWIIMFAILFNLKERKNGLITTISK